MDSNECHTLTRFADLPGRAISVIANTDIPAGTQIFAERPLLSISKRNESVAGLLEAFQALDHDYLRNAYMSLHNAWPAADALKGVFKTNSILLGDSGRAGVFAQICRINHSCSPNCVASWNSETLRLRIRSVLPISANEEITFSYIDPLQTRDARRVELLERYNFLCMCLACSSNDIDSRNERRMQAYNTIQSDTLYGSIPQEVIGRLEEAMRLLEKENLVGPRFMFSSAAYEAALRLRNIKLARIWAARAAEDARVILGPDDERYKLFEQYANG